MVRHTLDQPPRRGGTAFPTAVCLAVMLTAGCTGATGTGVEHVPRSTADAAEVRPPVAGMAFDYQIGGGYAPPDGVLAVSRDREDQPEPGLYNVCYRDYSQCTGLQPGGEANLRAALTSAVCTDLHCLPQLRSVRPVLLLDVLLHDAERCA
ncbi:hypothetical protein ACFXOA_32260, partial [Streptomyces sp. NPDC059166]